MKSKEEKIKELLENLYIPKGKNEEKLSLLDFLKEVNVRSFNSSDNGKIDLPVLQIVTRGKGKYETFQNWKIRRCDSWNISNEYALIALYDEDGNAKPYKIALDNPRFAIVA